jgi:hypothetical protein
MTANHDPRRACHHPSLPLSVLPQAVWQVDDSLPEPGRSINSVPVGRRLSRLSRLSRGRGRGGHGHSGCHGQIGQGH